jgi:hypothetical protein
VKKIKFGITVLTSLSIAYSPIASASMDNEQKAIFNHYTKENFKGNFNDFYRKQGGMLDEQSRGMMEAWLRKYGRKDLPQPQALLVKDKKGGDTLKLVFNQQGRTLTLTFTEGNYETFDANGVKVAFGDVRNTQALLSKLGENDLSLRKLAKSAEVETFPASTKTDMPSVAKFGSLSKMQKVEFLMQMRQTMEAAQNVFDVIHENKAQAQNDLPSPLFVFHPLFASQIAFAQSVTEGEACMVAGNLSVYEMAKKGLACAPFPKKYPQGFIPQPTFHDRCSNNAKGTMVACNPILYGGSESGTPICVDSANQPNFTRKATETCGSAKNSPLFDNEKDPDYRSKRLKDLERILKSYYLMKGGAADKIKDCFNQEHEISASCREIFEPQYKEFLNFKENADKVCTTVKLDDQKKACTQYRKRVIDLITYVDGTNRTVVPVNISKEKCLTNPTHKWDEDIQDCVCPDGQRATYNDTPAAYECPIPSDHQVHVTGYKPAKKDDCEKEDGSKSHSFKCDPAPWIIGACAIGVAAWMLCRNKPTPKPISTGIAMPPPTLVTVPTTPTTPPTAPPPTIPQGEGGSGQNPGNSGGTRGTH